MQNLKTSKKIDVLNDKTVNGLLNVKLKMNITTSGQPHNGLFISTDIHCGKKNTFFIDNRFNNSLNYDTNAINFWRNCMDKSNALIVKKVNNAIEANNANLKIQNITDSPKQELTELPYQTNLNQNFSKFSLIKEECNNDFLNINYDKLHCYSEEEDNLIKTHSLVNNLKTPLVDTNQNIDLKKNYDENEVLIDQNNELDRNVPIRLNLFNQDDSLQPNCKKKLNDAVKLYKPFNYNKSKENQILEDTTTTTTTIEVFREKLNSNFSSIKYFQLPTNSSNQIPQLISVNGPSYEKIVSTKTEFPVTVNKEYSESKVRWHKNLIRSASENSNNKNECSYYVCNPSSISSKLNKSNSWSEIESEPNNSNQNVNKSYSSLSNLSRPESMLTNCSKSTSNFSEKSDVLSNSYSNSENNFLKKCNDGGSVTTILRCKNEKNTVEKIIPCVEPENIYTKKHHYLSSKQKNLLNKDSNLDLQTNFEKYNAPPIPPKRNFLRRINSQPNVFFNKIEYTAPPRPNTRKPMPQYLSKMKTCKLQSNNCKVKNQTILQKENMLSDNSFKLYQTRDCLGNILYEL